MKLFFEKYERPALVFSGAALLTLVLMNLEFNLLEANLYDLRMTRGTSPQPDKDIVLITIDDETSKELGEFSPLPLDLHTHFLETLEQNPPKGIGYLVDMNRVTESNSDSLREEWSKRFLETTKRLQTKGTHFLFGTPFDVTGEVLPPYPLSTLPHAIAIIHKDGNVFSEDKITRRALTYLNDKPVFHMQFAQDMGFTSAGKVPRGSFYVPEIDGYQFFFRYHGPTTQTPNPSSSYTRLSFAQVIKGQLPSPDFLKNKILLVETLVKDDSADYASTPYSKTQYTNPKILIHANILDSIIHNDGIYKAPKWVNWVLTFASTAFVIAWVIQSTPLYGVFSTLGLLTVLFLSSLFLFSFKGVWLRLSQPLIGIFVSYYLVVPYRLIIEYKKRWNYQKKNDLLVQVEELKTNFLSLVTHDLKTPVARIQGLTEVLIRKASGRLLERDQETLHNILTSTEELNRFITSILELTKVESNRLQLHFESKDLNQIIERSIENFKTQSRALKIDIKANLEPLFPIKVDTSLISKVINNLIDNALKYSQAGSEILIQTQEKGEWIEVSVQDQGIGLTEEERKFLFTRFYRAKNDATAKISGTGLGLYLTKYFVEAHSGKVEVESELNKGSLFKILLPIELPDRLEGEAHV